ncbi:MAG: histidine phosphatase family protein [Desulfobacteraceae bacterium]
MRMSEETTPKPSKSASPDGGTIFLLRHGEIRSGGGKRYIGWQDHPLSDAGLAQARRWAGYFSGTALKAIYCSDLARCFETARIIGARCSLEPKVLPELREINLGAWDGQPFHTVQTFYPRAFQERGDHIADHRPPGGESFRDLQARVWPVFEEIARRICGPTLLVTHAGVIRVLLCRLLGMPLENLFCIGQTHGALNIIALRPESWRIQAMNLQFP